MNTFAYRAGEAHLEEVELARVAQTVGTPCYVYSRKQIQENARALRRAFGDYPTRICFAVKANGNLTVLRTLFAEGLGADIVSGGELARAQRAGAPADRIVFSGVGKTRAEMEAALAAGIFAFNVESLDEIADLDAAAAAVGKTAPLQLRINPNIDVKTNPYIATGLYSTKFGIAESDKAEILAALRGAKHCRLIGIACHLGSQLTELAPFAEGARRMAELARELQGAGWKLQTIDLGGGLGIRYADETPIPFDAYAETLLAAVRPTGLTLMLEPGRRLVGEAGVLLTQVLRLKKTPGKTFVVVDAAMNDLIRPCLYEAYHPIVPLKESHAPAVRADVVGPVCESADFLAQDREMPLPQKGEWLAVRHCGAYASSMASNYNTRGRAPEVWVEGDRFTVVSRRETLEDQLARED